MKLKWNDSQFNSPLSRARGLGAAHGHAVSHWMAQRVTAIANVILVGWLIMALTCLVAHNNDYAFAQKWISSGINPVMMILFVINTFYHAALGLQVIIEDYVYGLTKTLSIIALKLALFALAATCIVSVLKVAI